MPLTSSSAAKILPCKGRWHAEGMTEGYPRSTPERTATASSRAGSLLALAMLLATPTLAQTQPTTAAQTTVATPHAGTFNGRRVAYTAAIEPFAALDAAGKPAATIVAISYVAKDTKPDRPVLFVFNGGPIGPSSILHMGAFGPKRVAIPDDIAAPPSTFRLVDNSHTPLDVADIVFFDPAGTGFSTFAPGVDPATQFSVAADARQLQQLVTRWSAAHGRTAAPKYLVGESYGTMRAAEAARQLQASGTPLAGVVLLGQALNIIEIAQRPGNIVSPVVSLPTLAAIAWEHGKVDRRGLTLPAFAAEAKAFADTEYLSALYQGNTAPDATRRAVAAKLAGFTGIAPDYFLTHDLRIAKPAFQTTLLPGRRLGTNDARYAGPADGPDPFDIVPAAYAAQFADYLRRDLGARAPYVQANPAEAGGINGWGWGANRSPFGDWPYPRALGEVFAANPDFRVLVGNGWADTQTTVGAMDYLVAQSGWPMDRVRTARYRGGHMPYTIEASLTAFTDDVRAMVTKAW